MRKSSQARSQPIFEGGGFLMREGLNIRGACVGRTGGQSGRGSPPAGSGGPGISPPENFLKLKCP